MKYYYLSRPSSIGAQPEGFVEQETWFPKERRPEEFPRGAYGWVEYKTPLTFYRAWKYDLWPGGELHSKVFQFWLECDRDLKQTKGYIKNYYNLDQDKLNKYADEDYWACTLVRDLKQAGYDFEQVKELLEKQDESI